MAAELLMCISQEEITKPYKFKVGIDIFSFEEALYYIYHNWKETYDDFTSDDFLEWVTTTLGQAKLSSEIKELENIDNLGDRIVKFLSITDYFDSAQLLKLRSEVSLWEKQSEWEKLKSTGDRLMQQKKPDLAYSHYEKALAYEKNAILYNNIGMAFMEMEMYGKAVANLKRAHDMDKDNTQIIINLAEAYIYREDFEQAFKFLKKAEEDNENSDVYYLYARLCIENNNLTNAIDYLNKAISLKQENSYLYKLSEIYVRMRKYQDAIKTLSMITNRDSEFYIKKASAYGLYGDYSASIKCMKEALTFSEGKKNSDVWLNLAKYHRLNYENENAERAINESLKLNPKNEVAKLEQAKIKKSQGNIKEYQKSLNSILKDFKIKYRK